MSTQKLPSNERFAVLLYEGDGAGYFIDKTFDNFEDALDHYSSIGESDRISSDEETYVRLVKENLQDGKWKKVDSEADDIDVKEISALTDETKVVLDEVQNYFGGKYTNVELPDNKNLKLRIANHSANYKNNILEDNTLSVVITPKDADPTKGRFVPLTQEIYFEGTEGKEKIIQEIKDYVLKKYGAKLELGGEIPRLHKSVECVHKPTQAGNKCSRRTLNGNRKCWQHIPK